MIYKFALDNTKLSTRAVEGFIAAIRGIEKFSQADNLFENHLPKINTLTRDQHARLIESFNQNEQVRGAFKYNSFDVPGQLKRITNLTHYYEDEGELDYEPF